MGNKTTKLLYINDNDACTKSFLKKLNKNYQVYTATSEEESIQLLEKKSIQVVVADYRVSKNKGLQLLNKIDEIYPDPVRILISGEIVIGEVIEALNKSHIFAYISKKWKSERFNDIIDRAKEEYKKKQEEKEMNFRLQRTNEQLEFMLREKLVS